MNEALWDLYQRICQDEMVPLEEFVRRLAADEWGAYPKTDVLELLGELETMMLANIQMKMHEGARFAEMADEVSEQTHAEFEKLTSFVDTAFP
jgi:predicted TPR repeat methyltransferase